MAVLVEAISVVVLMSAISSKYPGGWQRFESDAPNQTLVSDGEVVRVGFMQPDAVQAFVESLKRRGLKFDFDTQPSEVCVVDQMRGKLSKCEWLATGEVSLDGDSSRRVRAAMLAGTESQQLFTPDGWEYEGSLSATDSFVPTEQVTNRLRFLRNENGLDVYWDTEKEKEVFVAPAPTR